MSLSQTDCLRYIAEEAAFITAQTTGASLLDLQQDIVLQRALVRSFEIIGKATQQLDNSFRQRHPQMEWKTLTAIKEKLVQAYFNVDEQFVFNTCQHIPKLLTDVERIMNTEENVKKH